MDSNQSEAERCIEIALKCVSSGENKQALRYLNKAENLYPTKRAKDLIAQLTPSRNAASGDTVPPDTMSSGGSDESAPGAHGTEGTARRRRNTDRRESGSASGNEHHDAPKFTEEQVAGVQSIRKCKNYYEILGVAQDCSEDDLKKAYKKLALKFHPDKNHAPGATEAFKAIGNAFAVLSNAEKRQRYDQFGSEEERVPVSSQRYYQHNGGDYYEYDFTRGFEGDISAEELFNMFFGGGFQTVHTTRRVYRHHHRATPQFHQRRAEHTDNSYSALLQLAPIAFLVIMWVLNAIFAPSPVFSLQANSKFNTRRTTSNLQVPYFVKSDFSTTFKGSLQRLEQQVEEDHVNNLKSNCFNEKSYRESLLWQARSTRDTRLYEETLNKKLPSCEALKQIYGG